MPTSSREAIVSATMRLFDDHARRGRRIHRLGLSMGGVVAEDAPGIQPDLFENAEKLSGERRRQEAISAVKKKFGKNSLLRGIDLLPEATARERNGQIGGHRSGE
jgi:DNA polymerase V